jgi:hypothetical protein
MNMMSPSDRCMFWQIMFEDGAIEFLDMTKEDWEFVTL